MPLANFSNDPEQEYFADGMTEELITSLSRIGALRVISRTSTARYKKTGKAVPEIARELNVDALVEGSVRRSGDRVRITVQLIEAVTDRHVWAESYERDLKDVLALQSEVARAIAGEIRARLTPEEESRLVRAGAVDPEGYQAYLKGRFHFESRNEADLKKSLDFFQQAVDRDPNYALAYAGLADAYLLLAAYGSLPTLEANARARPFVEKALALDDNLAEAHKSLAGIYHNDWNWVAAGEEYRRAYELNPNDVTLCHWYALYKLSMGRRDEGLDMMKRARELDPLSVERNRALGDAYLVTRRYDQAIEQYRLALALDPQYLHANNSLFIAYLLQGDLERAAGQAEKLRQIDAGPSAEVLYAAWLHVMSGGKDEVRRLLRDLERQQSQGEPSLAVDIGLLHAHLGEADLAFEWLEKAYRAHAAELEDLKIVPFFDPLRSDPRFQDLVRRVGLPPD